MSPAAPEQGNGFSRRNRLFSINGSITICLPEQTEYVLKEARLECQYPFSLKQGICPLRKLIRFHWNIHLNTTFYFNMIFNKKIIFPNWYQRPFFIRTATLLEHHTLLTLICSKLFKILYKKVQNRETT